MGTRPGQQARSLAEGKRGLLVDVGEELVMIGGARQGDRLSFAFYHYLRA